MKNWILSGNRPYHLLAFITALIWGTTLVSTKILLHHGLSPGEIMLYRFLIAYSILWIIHPKFYKFGGWKDELLFILTGLCGGSLYFITENTALEITLASNVALIVSTAPIITIFLAHLLVKGESLHRKLFWGSVIALLGVGFVVFNGNFILKLNPLGDLLSVAAATTWALYSVTLKKLDHKYPVLYITRKVFFYGMITLIPYFAFKPYHFDWEELSHPEVIGNLLFLGIIASSLCYILWNIAVKHIGSVRTNNYIYFIPLITEITSIIFLDEHITIYALIGTIFILGGVYYVENDLPFIQKKDRSKVLP